MADELPTRIRVLSANLWNGGADPDGVAELIERFRIDVVAAQELGPAQADAVRRHLPHGTLEPATDFTGMGIAARWPVAMRRLTLPRRDARIAELQLRAPDGAATSVELVNVHIEAPHNGPAWRTVARRRAQWRGLERHLKASPQRPRVVVGDFNSTPLWPFYRRVASHLHDAALIHARQSGRPALRTWGPWPGAPRLFRIDHAFVQHLDVFDFTVVDLPNGDHSAVVVEIGLKKISTQRRGDAEAG